MKSPSFDLEAPDHFTAGALGSPGERVFYLQSREARQVVTLKCEKEHVGALADYLSGLLTQLGGAGAEALPEASFLEPAEPAWAVGAIGVGYDERSDRVVVVVNEQLQEERQAEEPATARFQISRVQAAAFVERARALMKAGRPVCPFCSGPRDAGGHVCPRTNGHNVH
ncbi:MAG: DUF3090 domain-containing protein [Candidatus Rokuibacteriota bacterium]|nr:MAG: DUF3090 domain-containing protein [Candidatus Rokubacteria bacterium]